MPAAAGEGDAAAGGDVLGALPLLAGAALLLLPQPAARASAADARQ
ncbi:hypothetical protein ABIA35_006786 [Catenulispora sp. MAP12-49]